MLLFTFEKWRNWSYRGISQGHSTNRFLNLGSNMEIILFPTIKKLLMRVILWVWVTQMRLWEPCRNEYSYCANCSQGTEGQRKCTLITWGVFKSFCFIFYLFINFFFLLCFTLQYSIGFAIHWHESTMGVHEFPNMNPPPTSHSISSLWIIPIHQPQASCTLHQT